MDKNGKVISNSSYLVDMPIDRIKKSLVEALFTLMEVEPFEKISTKNICSEALVSRSTFYQHFEDKYHLLNYAIKKLSVDIQNKLVESNTELRLSLTLDYVLEHKLLFKSLYSSKPAVEIHEIILGIFYQDIINLVKRRTDTTLTTDMNIMAVFMANGIIYTIEHWVTDNCLLSKDLLLSSLNTVIEHNLTLFI